MLVAGADACGLASAPGLVGEEGEDGESEAAEHEDGDGDAWEVGVGEFCAEDGDGERAAGGGEPGDGADFGELELSDAFVELELEVRQAEVDGVDDALVEGFASELTFDGDGGDDVEFVDIGGDAGGEFEFVDDGVDLGEVEGAVEGD